MSTHNQRFLSEITKILKRAEGLAEAGYEDNDLRDLVTNGGARTEIFLKTAALPHLAPKTDFAGCINALKISGVRNEDRDTLHSLRKIYNESKHTAGYRPSLLEFQQLLPKVIDVFQDLGAKNLGRLNREERLQHSRVLWLAVCTVLLRSTQ